MALTFLYLLCITTTTNCLSIKGLDKSKGIYFDQLSNLQLVRDDWKIVAYYDLNPYWEGNKAYDKYYKHLEKVCDNIKPHINCNIIMIQLRHSYNELEHNNKVLLHQQTSAGTRRRRGLINGVGYLANSLFGVLDDHFAEQYTKDITLVRNNQKHLSLLWKNQTSVIEAEFNVLKRTEESMNTQHKIINKHLLALDNVTRKLISKYNETEYMTDFSISALAATNLLSQLKNIQNSLLDTITNIYNGNINLHLIDPQQLQKELAIISGQLAKELTLPIDNLQTNMAEIYHLLKVKARMTEQFLLFEIRIPLISRDSYVLYNIIAIPYQMGNKMVTLKPIEKHVAINIHKDSYIPIAQGDWDKCVARDSTTYLCQLKSPIYRLQSDQDFCKRDDNNTRLCRTVTSACQNQWISLTSLNQYLHFCCYQCQIKTLCQDQVTAQTLTGASLIQLQEDCMVKTENSTIYAHKQQQSIMKVTNKLETFYIAPINNIINLTVPTMEECNVTDVTDDPQLSDLHQQIENLKKDSSLAEDTDNMSIHDIHHYTLIYGLWGVMIIAAGVYVCRRARSRWQAPAAPAHSPCPAAVEVTVVDSTAVPHPTARSAVCRDSIKLSERVQVRECSAQSGPYYKDRGTSPVLKKIAFSDPQ